MAGNILYGFPPIAVKHGRMLQGFRTQMTRGIKEQQQLTAREEFIYNQQTLG